MIALIMAGMSKRTPLFEAQGIEKDYTAPDNQVLHVLGGIDFEIYPNEVVALIGPSGCGKSTLLRICAGLIPLSRGKLFHHGHRLHGLIPKMSMVFQNFALYPWMTVKQNIEIVLKAAHFSVKDMEDRTKEAIELIHLSGFEEAYPREISGGMKQRVGMARALALRPELLFMDEPFSEVDAFTAEVLRSEVIRIWSKKELGLSSILLVSHDVNEVAYMADRIIILGMNPTTVRGVIANPLPRPRNYHSPAFLKLVEELHDTYGSIQPSVKEKIEPLPPISHDELLGLLSYLHRCQNAQDIFKIGIDSHLHFDKVIVILKAAELLHFVEINRRTVSLTQTGMQFLEASEDKRREIWQKQLQTVSLFIKVLELIEKSPRQSLSQDKLLHFLKKAFPHHHAHVQFHLLLRWNHYGRLFSYHKKSKSITKDGP